MVSVIMTHLRKIALAAVIACAALPAASLSQTLKSPDDFIGHRIGADYKLARWETIVAYFRHAAEISARVNVHDMGLTTEGRPFIYAEISSDATIREIGRHRENQKKLADPRLIRDEAEEKRLVDEAKVVVFINCNLHSTEIASSQMAMELLYDLATGDTPEIRDILDRTIVILVPSANPDGLEKVIEWYERSLGKPWEGGGMPWLYHTYAGHDNNRDWFMLNLTETQLESKVIYGEWFPHIVYDIHQMGSENARFFMPPFFDPKNPNIHPLTDDMMLIIGGHMAAELTRAGKQGILHSAMYDNWWQGGFRTTVYRHNMVGLLTEAASVNIASPLFQRLNDLDGGPRGMPDYGLRTNFPDPWPGGWWRLRDIVEYEKIACMSVFTLAARYHDLFQENYIKLGREAIERGNTEPPYAWIVPPDQRDIRAAYDMVRILHETGIEVHRAGKPFSADGVEYPAGTYIMYCAQPYRSHLVDMLERQDYPNRTRYPGGPPEQPYDMAGWTLSLKMGVRAIQVDHPFDAETAELDSIPLPAFTTPGGGSTYAVRAGSDDDFRLMNRLYRAGVGMDIVTKPDAVKGGDGQFLPAGSIIVHDSGKLNKSRESIGSGLTSLLESASNPSGGTVKKARKPRLALYQPWTASADEGWTRFVLDSHEYDYTSLHNAEIRAGNLRDRYDCIVLPSVGANSIVEGNGPDTTEPQYVGGIGPEGIVSLQEFVRGGGTLVCIDASCSLPIRHFNIPVKNVLDGTSSSDFFCPGSVLRLWVDTAHPVGFGMPEWTSAYFSRSQAFDIDTAETEKKDGAKNARKPENRYPAKVVARYSDTVLLESGWIHGGDLIADKPAIVDVGYEKGHIVLIGFAVQHRGQTAGTYRLLFNAIQGSVK